MKQCTEIIYALIVGWSWLSQQSFFTGYFKNSGRSFTLSVNPLRRTQSVFLRVWSWKAASQHHAVVFQNSIDASQAASRKKPGHLQGSPVARQLPCQLPWRWLCGTCCAEWQLLHAAVQAVASRLPKATWKAPSFVRLIDVGQLVAGTTVKPLFLWLTPLLHHVCPG